MLKKVKTLKEYLGLPTISIGGLDSYHPIADLGDIPPKGKGSKDARVTGLQANYDTQAPGTMRPFLTASAKKLQQKNWKEKGFGSYNFKKQVKEETLIEKIGYVVRYTDSKNKKFATAFKMKKDAENKSNQLKKSGMKDISITTHNINYNNQINFKGLDKPLSLEDKEFDKFLKDLANNTPNADQFDEEITLNDIKMAAQRFAKGVYDKIKRIATTSKRYEYAAKVLQDVIDRKKKERAKEGLPLRHDIGYYAAAVADTFKDIDSKKLQSMVHEELSPFKKKILQKISKPIKDYNKNKKEDTNRIARKPGQPAGSDKHSDLYTDENPKGTIQGLGFTDAETARTSVNKIKNSGRSHAHKIQAAIAMSQRAKVASERAKDPKKKKDLGAAHKIYQTFIDTNKKEK